MVSEIPLNPIYVVQPELIQLAEDVINLSRQFGISNTGRLLAFYPFNYIELIEDKVDISSLKTIRQQTFEASLQQLRENSVKNLFSINPVLNWLQMASNANKDGFVNRVVPADEFEDFVHFTDYLYNQFNRYELIDASETNFAIHLNNIFMASPSLIIVDPYFMDDKRFSSLANLILCGSKTKKCKEIEIVVGLADYYKKFNEKDGSSIRKYASCFNIDHSYTKINYTIVNDQGNQNLLHERLILSVLGVLDFDRGLEVNPRRKEKITCAPKEQYDDAWGKYRNMINKHPGSISIPLNYNT